MNKKGIIGIVFIILTAFTVYYFLNKKGTSTEQNTIVKIGVILPLTGPAAQIGKDILEGITLAESKINETNEHNFKFKLYIEDSKVEPKFGVAAAEKLISVDKVDFIIGPASSGVSLAVAPICERNKIVMLSPTASTPELTKSGNYVYRIYPSDIYDGEILSNFAYNELKIKNISMLYLNNDFGIGLNKIFEEEFIKNGGTIDYSDAFSEKEHDFKTLITKLKSKKTKGLFLVALVDQYTKVLKQLKELGVNDMQILAPVTFDDASIYDNQGNIAEGVIYTRPYFDPDNSNKIVTEFVSDFEKKYFKKPSILNALGYDSYLLTVKAFEQNDYKKGGITNILNSISDFNGASGEIKFDKNGDVIKQLQIMTIKKSKAVQYE